MKHTVEIENIDEIVVAELSRLLECQLLYPWHLNKKEDNKDTKALVRVINMFLPSYEQRTLNDYKEA